MKILQIIILLSTICFSAPVLNGAECTQVVTINSSSVSETNTHFLYQRKIPRTGAIAANVDAASDVGMTLLNDTTRVPRWVVFTTDTIFLYADIAVSTSDNKQYRLHYGKALNETNASATFTNCGITNFWGFDEGTGSSANDYAGSKNFASINNLNFGISYFKSGIISSSLDGNMATASTLDYSNASKMVMSVILKRTSISSPQIAFGYRTIAVKNISMVFSANNQIQIQSVFEGGTFITTPTFTSTDYVLYTLVYDGNLTNDNRYRLYVNGSIVSGSVSGTIPTTLPATTYPMLVGYTSPYSTMGNYDNLLVGSNAYTGDYELTRYNMLFSPSTFSTLGNIQTVVTSGNKWSGYKYNNKWQAYKRAYK